MKMNVKYEQIIKNAIIEYYTATTSKEKENAINMMENVNIMVSKYNYSSKNYTKLLALL